MLNKLLTWKIYTWFLIGVITIPSMVLFYYATFTPVFSGVDGGIGIAVGLIYIFLIVVFFVVTECLYLWLRHHPKILRLYLIVFWICLVLVIIGAILYSIVGARQQAYYEQHFANPAQGSTRGVQIIIPN